MFIIRSAAIAAALAAAFPAVAQSNSTNPATLPEVTVTANGIPTRDSDATYASEVHDRAEIEASGAATLYDFLAQHTALNVQSSFGNKNAPALDLRGYGSEAGFQNVVIVVDGYRLNNIDQTGQLIGSIPLDAIESIEISKGSGSVTFGDGAMAGVIQIHTRKGYTGVTVSTAIGSRGAQEYGVNAGLSQELFDLTLDANRSKQPSLSAADSTGSHDGSDNATGRVNLTVKPINGLKLFVGGGQSHIDTRYVSGLTPVQFSTNPGQAPAFPYTHQIYDSTQWRVGGEYEFASGMTFRYVHDGENKTSEFVGSTPAEYSIGSDDASIRYASKAFDLTVGVQQYKGERFRAQQDNMSKDSKAIYAQGVYRIDQWTLSAGMRREQAKYNYVPVGGTAVANDYMLSAFDFGTNYRFNEQWSGFVNLNQGFQAPDIDRPFVFDPITFASVYSALPAPAKVKTITVGANWDTRTNRLRADVFYSKLHDEIYFDPFTGINTNLERSHKYGFELSDRWQVTDTFALSTLYNYTQALIDDGSYSGKELPGVPRNTATLGANWQPWANGTLNLTQTWRSSSYAISDFNNVGAYRQGSYNMTSINFSQRWKAGGNSVDGFVAIDNLFNQTNGLWVYSASLNTANIYPVDFRRLVRVGMKIGF